MNPQQPAPIIIINRKKAAHAGHHGGAWKVAYADFVTAMMALFIVLWLMNSSEKVKQAISAYFRDPSSAAAQIGSASTGTGDTLKISLDDMEKLRARLEEAIKQKPELEKLKDFVQFSVTGEGLRVELLESEKGTFFQSGSAAPSAAGEDMIAKLAEQLVQLPNNLMIEGHTDAKPFAGATGYTNWELSADRANAARRIIEAHGARAGQVAQVRGFADQSLRDRAHPEDAKNRRVSVIVRYQDVSDAGPAAEAKPGPPGSHKTAPASTGKPPEIHPATAAEHH